MHTQHQNDFSKTLILSPPAPQWHSVLTRFDPIINLTQMNEVALLNRTDTKYVLTLPQLYGVLTLLTEDYRVLDIDGIRLNQYRTLYFDTTDFALYLRHHAGGRNRYKVRSRKYLDTSQSFLEIKRKTDENRTIKNRIQTPGLVTYFTQTTSDFVEAHLPLNPQWLESKLWNDFFRITLVSKHHQERLTLDLNMQFYSDRGTVELPGIAIAEVKQDGVNHKTRISSGRCER